VIALFVFHGASFGAGYLSRASIAFHKKYTARPKKDEV
jgi:hypothetical protein